jgi:hypothetical protein
MKLKRNEVNMNEILNVYKVRRSSYSHTFLAADVFIVATDLNQAISLACKSNIDIACIGLVGTNAIVQGYKEYMGIRWSENDKTISEDNQCPI